MPISKTPPIGQMTAEDQAAYESLEDVATEHIGPVQDVAATAADLRPQQGYRFIEERVVGLPKKVRLRSLSTKDFRHVQNEDGTNDLSELVRVAVVDANGHQYLSLEDVHEFQNSDTYDQRTWQHLLQLAITHCLGGTLEDLTELAEKN